MAQKAPDYIYLNGVRRSRLASFWDLGYNVIWCLLGRWTGFLGSIRLSQLEDWMGALSCCPLDVIFMCPLTQNPNYSGMKPCECMDLCCVCETDRNRELSVCVCPCVTLNLYHVSMCERDRRRWVKVRLNHISTFGMKLRSKDCTGEEWEKEMRKWYRHG